MRHSTIAGVLVLMLAACSSGATTTSVVTTAAAVPVLAPSVASATTSTIPATVPTTTAPTTTLPATTTSTATTIPVTTAISEPTIPPTTLPSPISALVWESAKDAARVNRSDAAPTASSKGITIRIQLYITGPATAPGSWATNCLQEIDIESSQATSCLTVQLSMDVAADFKVNTNSDEGQVLVDACIDATGKQHSVATVESAYPGTNGTLYTQMIAGCGPGSTLKVQTGSNLVGYTTHSFVVPGADEFQPITWYDD